MVSITTVLLILGIHYVCDFLLQANKWAESKYKLVEGLLPHALMYIISTTLFYAAFGLFSDSATNNAKFVILNFLMHLLTDAISSNVTHHQFANKQYGSSIPNIGAFTTIGADQLLHYIVLFITYKQYLWA